MSIHLMTGVCHGGPWDGQLWTYRHNTDTGPHPMCTAPYCAVEMVGLSRGYYEFRGTPRGLMAWYWTPLPSVAHHEERPRFTGL